MPLTYSERGRNRLQGIADDWSGILCGAWTQPVSCLMRIVERPRRQAALMVRAGRAYLALGNDASGARGGRLEEPEVTGSISVCCWQASAQRLNAAGMQRGRESEMAVSLCRSNQAAMSYELWSAESSLPSTTEGLARVAVTIVSILMRAIPLAASLSSQRWGSTCISGLLVVPEASVSMDPPAPTPQPPQLACTRVRDSQTPVSNSGICNLPCPPPRHIHCRDGSSRDNHTAHVLAGLPRGRCMHGSPTVPAMPSRFQRCSAASLLVSLQTPTSTFQDSSENKSVRP
ncbi:hypothetical protein ST47_g2044 [Ascochyta rabiei]|uniref:Uncharacterized protein n=1 Tax=Didymella rabiei TaxID=5454 RepID=A0A163K6X6_DIDRA|nr:hypothetical protein ST47_g2044 [Ascochyta rabiei]